MSADQGFSRLRAGGVIVVALSATAIGGLWATQHGSLRKEAERRQAALDAGPRVRVGKEKEASQALLQGYCRVVAPFSGMVTQRFVDPGALVQNGGNSSTAQPLLALAQVDRLRVVLYLDQDQAARIKVGQGLEVFPAGRPDLSRKLVVARISGALDPRTRTLQVEADLDNRDRAFPPGGAVVARLSLPQRPGLEIPSEAVVFKGDQARAAVVGADQKVHFQTLLLGEDSGTQVRVLKGLKAGDRVILTPPVSLRDGDRVQGVELR